MVKISSILQIITYLVVVISYAAVFQYVEPYYSVSFGFLFLLSLYLTFNRFVRISRWILNTISIVVLIVSVLTVTPEYLVEPVLGALVVLIAIKLLDEKAFRDYAQIFAMCIFLLIGSSLLSLSIVFLIYFSLTAVLSTTGLILLAYFVHDPETAIHKRAFNKVLLQSLLICGIALPGSLIFFVILPRTNYPILSFLNRDGYARAGFTDSINLGEISEIQENNAVIFRAETNRLNDNDLFWRGIVLDKFDGRAWESSDKRVQLNRLMVQGPKVEQVIYLEPYGNRYLFALDKPVSVSLRHLQDSNDLMYSLPEHFHERIRYEAASIISDFLPDNSPVPAQYLQLPSHFSPKISQLVSELCSDKRGIEAIKALLTFFKRGDFSYSMKNLPTTENPLESFLFLNRSGNCEFFASSLAVMLRIAGIPARLVGGYRGGYYNRAAGYYMVLQNNAHVWVEAYLRERHGWLRIDPTTYARADRSINGRQSLFMRVKLMMDTFNYYWYKFIINYDFSKQLALIRKLKATIQKPDVQIGIVKNQVKQYLYYLLALPLLVFFGYALLRIARKRADERLVAKFQNRMSHLGYRRKNYEGLEEFTARIEEADLRQKAEQFVDKFESIYYRDRNFNNDDKRLLERYISEL